MIIHSTADMYAARRKNVSQLKKTLDGTHAVAVLRYQSALYATIIKTRSESKATDDSEFEHSTEGEHQFQETSEGQSMTDTTMTQPTERIIPLPSIDAWYSLQDYVLQKTSTTGNVKVPYRILRLDAIAGVNAKEAIGMPVAGKTGDKVPYTRQDLKYGLTTQGGWHL
jgi:hypothetical protein